MVMVQFLHFIGVWIFGFSKDALRSHLNLKTKKEKIIKEMCIQSTYLYLATSNSEGGI